MANEILKKGIVNVKSDDFLEWGKKFYLQEKEIKEMNSAIYKRVLKNAISDKNFGPFEVENLIRFKQMLQIETDALSNVHLELLADFNTLEPNMEMEKYVFFTERVFSSEGSVSKAYHELCSKFREKLENITQMALLKRVCNYSKPYYEELIKKVIENPSEFNAEALMRTRRKLGISEVVSGGMHLSKYQEKIFEIVKKSNKIDLKEKQYLAKIRGVLGISQFEADRTIESVTSPIYRQILEKSLEQAMKMDLVDSNIEPLKLNLQERKDSLHLGKMISESILKETIRKIAQKCIDRAVFTVRNPPSGGPDNSIITNAIKEVLRLREVVFCIFDLGSEIDKRKYFGGVLCGSASNRISALEKKAIYGCYLSHCLKENVLSEECRAMLWELNMMLELGEKEGYAVYLEKIRPMVESKLIEMAQANEPWDQNKVAVFAKNLAIPQSLLEELSIEAYATQLGAEIRASGTSFTDSSKIKLEKMAKGLGLSKAEVEELHDLTLDPHYRSAIGAVLQATWADSHKKAEIGELIKDGAEGIKVAIGPLEILRVKLGMSYERANEAYIEAFADFVGPKWEEIYQAIQLGQDSEENFIDLLCLIQFCEEGGKMGEMREVAPSNTFSGVSSLTHLQGEKIYTFLLKCGLGYSDEEGGEGFTAKAEFALNKLDSLAEILAMDRKRAKEIKKKEGLNLFGEYASSVLEAKWALSERDLEVLKFIQEKLNLTPIICGETINRTKKTFLRGKMNEISPLLLSKQPSISSVEDESIALCSKIRNAVKSMGLLWREDLAVPDELRKRMFVIEAFYILYSQGKNGLNKDVLEDLRSSLDLKKEDVDEIRSMLMKEVSSI
eukprot:CAMPEP_0171470436 /NCGR_PEP_ID=MMETSP0946-20130122/153_1 /TAXON_ID=109269 /ORGANISM="Vaucheria litorea, Strain CCMP2940" /LENGTH=842 /DNA_ID=CAMNT_0011999825 /DNA_START=373 /DNA_END=2901 /DNA_ORIENTATION=-